jgi:uncharacterized protein (DUF58 family)
VSSLIDSDILARFEPQLKRIRLKTRRSLDSDLIGNYRSAFRGTGLSFAELREYTPGDEIKRIDWRATARAGKVYVKSFEEERQLSVILAVDTSASSAAGLGSSFLTQTLTFASLIATLSALNNDLCGLITFSDTIGATLTPSNRRSQSRKIISTLVTQKPAGKTDIAAALLHIRQHFRRKSLVFLLSDFCAPAFDEALRSVALHHDLVLVLPSQRLDLILPQRGIVSFRDPETGQEFLIDCTHKKTRLALEKKIHQHHEALRQQARAAGADLIEISDDPLRSLNELMDRRGRRVR